MYPTLPAQSSLSMLVLRFSIYHTDSLEALEQNTAFNSLVGMGILSQLLFLNVEIL